LSAGAANAVKDALWRLRCRVAGSPTMSRVFRERGDRDWIRLEGPIERKLDELGLARARCRVAFSIPVVRAVDHINVGYADRDSHFFVRTAAELLADPNMDPSATYYSRFVRAFQPASLSDVFGPNHLTDAAVAPLSRKPAAFFANGMPWSTAVRARTIRTEEEIAHFGPRSATSIETEVARLKQAARALGSGGYAPERHRDGFVRGFLLCRGRDYRFVVTSGKHRMPALVLAGQQAFDAVFEPNDFLPIVDIDDAARWPQVSAGVFNTVEARAVFETYFESTGDQGRRLRTLAAA
jgi:hypothetical protein